MLLDSKKMCVTSVAKEKQQENFTYYKKSASQKQFTSVVQQPAESTEQKPEVIHQPVDHSQEFHYQPSDKPFLFNFSTGDDQGVDQSCKIDDSPNSPKKEGTALQDDGETEHVNYYKMNQSDNSFRFNFSLDS